MAPAPRLPHARLLPTRHQPAAAVALFPPRPRASAGPCSRPLQSSPRRRRVAIAGRACARAPAARPRIRQSAIECARLRKPHPHHPEVSTGPGRGYISPPELRPPHSSPPPSPAQSSASAAPPPSSKAPPCSCAASPPSNFTSTASNRPA